MLTGSFPDKAQRPTDDSSGGGSTCPVCLGKGRVPQRNKGGRGGRMGRTQTCLHCHGTGKATKGYETK